MSDNSTEMVSQRQDPLRRRYRESPDLAQIADHALADVRGCLIVDRHWLRRAHAWGATLASACSGSVLLAQTGLLDGQEATSHWAYCD